MHPAHPDHRERRPHRGHVSWCDAVRAARRTPYDPTDLRASGFRLKSVALDRAIAWI